MASWAPESWKDSDLCAFWSFRALASPTTAAWLSTVLRSRAVNENSAATAVAVPTVRAITASRPSTLRRVPITCRLRRGTGSGWYGSRVFDPAQY